MSRHSNPPRARRARKLTFDQLESRAMLAANIVGDFNGDGADDLAVGVPLEEVGGFSEAGAVNVIYGLLGSGLQSPGNQFWTQNSSGILDQAAANEFFGQAVAAGDFNDDGFDDLVVGVPSQTVNTVDEAGAVHVIYGSGAGLTSLGNQLWSQDSSGILNAAGPASFEGEAFGRSLAVGDFNGDGTDDLAIGVPAESSIADRSGAVNVIYGTSGVGLTSTGNQFWTQNSSGILGVSDSTVAEDLFGWALAAGDFDADTFNDLAIGVPGEGGTGAVNIIMGSAAGLTSAGNLLYSQDSSGILDVGEPGDFFGGALAVGDFDGNTQDDLAIGVYREDRCPEFPGNDVQCPPGPEPIIDGGIVHVLYSGRRTHELGEGTTVNGLTAFNNQVWSQDKFDIADTAESDDWFGASLAAGDFSDNDDVDDLVIGVPGESQGLLAGAGAIHIIQGYFGAPHSLPPGGLLPAGAEFWTQDTSGILEAAEAGDRFGTAICVGDFNGDENEDLAIGVPEESVGAILQAGAVNVIYSDTMRLTKRDNQLWHQNTSGILDESEEFDFFGEALPGSNRS